MCVQRENPVQGRKARNLLGDFQPLMLDILHVMKSDKYGHFNPVKEREMQEWIGKNTGRLGRLAGSKAHRSHHQQLNWSHGRCKIWVEATETQGNTMGQRQNHKQRHHGQTKREVRGCLIQSDSFCESSIKAAQVSAPFVHSNKRQDVELSGNSLSRKALQCHQEEEIQVSINNCQLKVKKISRGRQNENLLH